MTFDEGKAEAEKYLNEWVPKLLPGWIVTADFKEGLPGKSAESRTRWEYMQVHVIFYPDDFNEVSNPDIESLVVHELVHGMLAQITNPDRATKGEERVTTMIETALLRVKRAGL